MCFADFPAGGICTPPGGGACTEQLCIPEEEKPEGGLEGRVDSKDEPETKPGGEPVQCGTSTFEKGQVCCNESCGICAAPDGACTMRFCLPEEEEEEEIELGEQCGSTICPDDEYCCNSSCEVRHPSRVASNRKKPLLTFA